MKNQLLPLLKYELGRFTWLVPLVYGYFVMGIYRKESDRTDYMFNLDGNPQVTSNIMILWFAFTAIFLATGWGAAAQRSGGMAGWGAVHLDFFFSRAINRRTWFAVKTTLFALLALSPAIYQSASSHKSPVIRIELPYNSTTARTEMTAFYRANFVGAHLEKPDTGRNEDYLVLPRGKQDMQHLENVLSILALIAFQTLAFLFWPRGWGLAAAFFGIIIAFFCLIFLPRHSPSRYEEGMAFVANHPATTAVALVLFYLACQLYCGWRFVRTETLT